MLEFLPIVIRAYLGIVVSDAKIVGNPIDVKLSIRIIPQLLKNVQRQCTRARITNLPLESVAAKTQKPKRKSNEQTYCGILIEIY